MSVMRIGRQPEFYLAAQKAALLPDDVARFSGIVKNAGFAIWLLHDSIGWAHSTGIIKVDNVQHLNRRGNQFWFIAVVATLVNELHRLRWNGIKTHMEVKALVSAKKKKDDQELLASKTILAQLDAYVFTIIHP